MNHKGKFIVIEGNEGAGKTLQVKLLTQYLQSKGIEVYSTREPTAGPIGKIIRSEYLSGKRKSDPRILNMLYVADRLDHITNEEDGFLKKINEGTTVISDRYYMSSAACHASLYFNNTDTCYDEMFSILDQNKVNMDKIRPDITIFIDIDAEESYKRITSRSTNPEIFESLESIQNIKICYDRAIKHLSISGDFIVKIDGNDSIDCVHNLILSEIHKILEI